MKRSLLAFVLAAVLPASALAATVTMPQNSTLVLPTDSSTYTLASGSSFDSLTVNSTSFAFTMSAGETVSLTAVSTQGFGVSGSGISISTNCGPGRTTVSLPAGASTQVVTVTPAASCTPQFVNPAAASSAGGGGGGGGGPGLASLVPVYRTTVNGVLVSTSTAGVAAPAAGPIASSGTGSAASSSISALAAPKFSAVMKDLALGVSGADVTRLQILLALDSSVYPSGKITGYFGPATLKAVRLFQAKHGVSKAGKGGYGRVGPATRAMLNGLYGAK